MTFNHIRNLVMVAVLGGCATSDTFIHTIGNDHWQLNGKIGLVYPEKGCVSSDCRKRSDQGKIDWRQQQQSYTITLNDPFDRIVLTIDGDNQQLQAKSPNQLPMQTTPNEFVALIANNADNPALLSLSPTWLSYWVTGRPAPNTTVSESSGNRFVQHGYSIDASQWRDTEVGKMPSLVIVSKGEFTLRLVIRAWSKPSP